MKNNLVLAGILALLSTCIIETHSRKTHRKGSKSQKVLLREDLDLEELELSSGGLFGSAEDNYYRRDPKPAPRKARGRGEGAKQQKEKGKKKGEGKERDQRKPSKKTKARKPKIPSEENGKRFVREHCSEGGKCFLPKGSKKNNRKVPYAGGDDLDALLRALEKMSSGNAGQGESHEDHSIYPWVEDLSEFTSEGSLDEEKIIFKPASGSADEQEAINGEFWLFEFEQIEVLFEPAVAFPTQQHLSQDLCASEQRKIKKQALRSPQTDSSSPDGKWVFEDDEDDEDNEDAEDGEDDGNGRGHKCIFARLKQKIIELWRKLRESLKMQSTAVKISMMLAFAALIAMQVFVAGKFIGMIKNSYMHLPSEDEESAPEKSGLLSLDDADDRRQMADLKSTE